MEHVAGSHHQNTVKTLIRGATNVLAVGDKMRSLRRDKRGISPIIATILLIAVTAVAAGVIAAFATNLFVPSTSIRVMSCVGSTVFDYDDSAQLENYKNGNITIVLRVETGTYRSIGDPQYGGTTVTVSNPMTGMSVSVPFAENTNKWGSEMSGYGVGSFSGWSTSSAGYQVKMKATMSPDSQGRLTAGSSITIMLWPDNSAADNVGYFGNAHVANDNAWDYNITGLREFWKFGRDDNAKAWDEGDQLTVSFTNRDSATFTGYDARLYGSGWVL
jgi:flagellin-like protein